MSTSVFIFQTFSYFSELHEADFGEEEIGESQLIPANSHSHRGQLFAVPLSIRPSLCAVLLISSGSWYAKMRVPVGTLISAPQGHFTEVLCSIVMYGI